MQYINCQNGPPLVAAKTSTLYTWQETHGTARTSQKSQDVHHARHTVQHTCFFCLGS